MPYLIARDTGVEVVNMVVLNACCEEFQNFRERYIRATAHGIDVAAVVALPRLVASFEGVLQVEQELTWYGKTSVNFCCVPAE